MTNMQHYMEDITDILGGLDTEMEKRYKRIGKWDAQIAEWQKEAKKAEEIVFNPNKSIEKRSEKAIQLADLTNRIRHLSEKKVSFCERNSKTIDAIYKKITELAYHCKCEVEIDNPGSTEIRERLFIQAMTSSNLEADGPSQFSAPIGRATREMSILTDDDGISTRSVTPVPKERKRGVGRPRNVLKENSQNKGSTMSSTRSSVDREVPPNRRSEKLSSYMRKKQEKQRVEEERKRELVFDQAHVKREVIDTTDNYGGFGGPSDGPNDDDTPNMLELLEAFPPGILSDLPLPPQDILDGLEIDGPNMLSMGDDVSNNEKKFFEDPSTKPHKREHAAHSMSSGEPAEKRRRNTLFGSKADTSFSGRPRKLTDRVCEMVQMYREREERRKTKDDSEDWCICDGNVNSEMMVACDNAHCKIGWYHFECVGLTANPKDDWFCPSCSRIPPHMRLVQPRDD
ncbi:unnamed protein product [Caenorhabditis bovis]|uniref:PHD-type domain-containing protein n=1 Tax=Caenorhabditis bovis TaxID=2654633 RepID=A0A8S1ESB2_9PELO|nr:unnamed protein product [Caenorhabditis bovis]